MTDTSIPADESQPATGEPTTPAETPTTPSAGDSAPESEVEGHVHDLLGRLRLDVNNSHVATVLGWLDEVTGKL